MNFDTEALSAIRDSYLGDDYAWPAWSYLPGVAVAANLADQIGLIGLRSTKFRSLPT